MEKNKIQENGDPETNQRMDNRDPEQDKLVELEQIELLEI